MMFWFNLLLLLQVVVLFFPCFFNAVVSGLLHVETSAAQFPSQFNISSSHFRLQFKDNYESNDIRGLTTLSAGRSYTLVQAIFQRDSACVLRMEGAPTNSYGQSALYIKLADVKSHSCDPSSLINKVNKVGFGAIILGVMQPEMTPRAAMRFLIQDEGSPLDPLLSLFFIVIGANNHFDRKDVDIFNDNTNIDSDIFQLLPSHQTVVTLYPGDEIEEMSIHSEEWFLWLIFGAWTMALLLTIFSFILAIKDQGCSTRITLFLLACYFNTALCLSLYWFFRLMNISYPSLFYIGYLSTYVAFSAYLIHWSLMASNYISKVVTRFLFTLSFLGILTLSLSVVLKILKPWMQIDFPQSIFIDKLFFITAGLVLVIQSATFLVARNWLIWQISKDTSSFNPRLFFINNVFAVGLGILLGLGVTILFFILSSFFSTHEFFIAPWVIHQLGMVLVFSCIFYTPIRTRLGNSLVFSDKAKTLDSKKSADPDLEALQFDSCFLDIDN